MFTHGNGIRLDALDLWLDARRPVARSFMSHAHSDHIARHEAVLCTAATAALAGARQGKRPATILPFGEAVDLGPVAVSAFPAGHCLGSAMLKVEDGRRSLLYSGDFRLRPEPTCEPAEVPTADILIMECTYGHPRYRFPGRDKVAGRLVGGVEGALRRGAIPIVFAYSLGKAQEVRRILADAGIPAIEHPAVARMSDIYEVFGVDLGVRAPLPPRPFDRAAFEGHALIWPPSCARDTDLRGLWPTVKFRASGWTLPAAGRRGFGSVPIPLSGHADYDELLELVRRVDPAEVYVTHGPDDFARRIKAKGRRVAPLSAPRQRTLF